MICTLRTLPGAGPCVPMKLKEILQQPVDRVADSSVARLVHVQQYGAELPYDERGVSKLVENYNSVSGQYIREDEYYFHENKLLYS